MKQITFSTQAVRDLRKLAPKIQASIIAKLETYAENPDALANNVTTLKGFNGLKRLRVGDYRVIFGEDLTVVSIERVGHRRDVYDH